MKYSFLPLAVLLAILLSSCGETNTDIPSTSTIPTPEMTQIIESVSPPVPSDTVDTKVDNPRLILNSEDPLANNDVPKLTVDYLSDRELTPLLPDMLDEMPTQTYTSYVKGWNLHEVLPVGYHMYLEFYSHTSYVIEKVDVFSLCEVSESGLEDKLCALFDGAGRQITNGSFSPEHAGYIASLPTLMPALENKLTYIDENGNISIKNELLYLGTDDDGWNVYNAIDDVASYYVFTTPTGKEIVYKTTPDDTFTDYGLFPNNILILCTDNYVVAYNKDGKPVWKLEFGTHDRYTFQINNGQNNLFLLLRNSNEKMALFNNNGVQLTDFIYDQVVSSHEWHDVLVEVGGKYGLLDTNGNLVLPCEYDAYIQQSLDLPGVILCKDGLYGYMEDPSSGEWTIPCKYEYIQYIDGMRSLCIKKNDSYYIWQDGNIGNVRFDDPLYKSSLLDDDIYCIPKEFVDGTLVKADGIILAEYVDLICVGDNGLILYFDYATSLYGYMNSAAEVVIEPQYELASDFYKGFAIVKNDGHIKLIDQSTRIILDTIYDDVICWNPETMIMAVVYYPNNISPQFWSRGTGPEGRCGLVKILRPD